MKNLIKYFLIVFISGFVFSCKKDVPPHRPQSSGTISAAKKLIICNEGNFGTPNATISVYDPSTGAFVYDAYGQANSGQFIGDELQSGVRHGEQYFWAVNNSHKIVITDRNFIKLTSVSGFISPRYIQFVSNSKAYISNLQLNYTSSSPPNYIQVLNVDSSTVKQIRLDGWTEQMVESYGKVYVCSMSKKYVYVINSSNDLVVDSIFVNATNCCIVKDQNEKIWVSCNADASGGIPARLVRINPQTDTVEAEISLQTTQNSVSRLVINGAGNTLYYLMTDVFKISINAATSSLSFIQQGSRLFYGICVDPVDETIYVSDAIDNNQDGNILRYKPDGTYINTFKAGVSPGFMWIED
jgi:hypothetical protein